MADHRLLVGYPVWWALGLADFTWVLLAVPMVARMITWHRSEPPMGAARIWHLCCSCSAWPSGPSP